MLIKNQIINKGFIIRIVYGIYKEVAGTESIAIDEVPHTQCCDYVVERFGEKFKELCKLPIRIIRKDGHCFAIIEIQNKIIYVDPTWKQFLGYKNISAPNVLINTPKKFLNDLRRYGVANDKLIIWNLS